MPFKDCCKFLKRERWHETKPFWGFSVFWSAALTNSRMDHVIMLTIFLQVAELALGRVWPEWRFSSSSPLFFSAFVSLLLLESQRMSWIWPQPWASASVHDLRICALSDASDEYDKIFIYFVFSFENRKCCSVHMIDTVLFYLF